MVLFDRSRYNRAGVERVMGFCSDAEYEQFFQDAPEFERMLVRSGIQLIKYWFSITDEEQEMRFKARIHDPVKQWKLSQRTHIARLNCIHHLLEQVRYAEVPHPEIHLPLRERREGYRRSPTPADLMVPEIY